MKRIIKNYSSVSKFHLDLIVEAYPEGFGEGDLKTVVGSNGRIFRCLEVKTEDAIYLFQIDEQMVDWLEEESDDNFEIGDIEDTFNDEY